MKRPKFSIANLLMLTLIVAMGALVHRDRIRIQHMEAQLQHMEAQIVLHEAVRAQAWRVGQQQLELRAASQQMQPELELAALYRMTGVGDRLMTAARPQQRASGTLAIDAATVWQSGMEFTIPVGHRRAQSRLRHSQLRLAREQAILGQLEKELDQRTAKPRAILPTNTK